MVGRVPIYFINLADRVDRRAFMERQFSTLGLEAERVEAVTPADLAPEDIAKYCWPAKSMGLAPTEMGCSESHFECWRRLIRSNAALALVLEDDAIISASLPRFLAELSGSDVPGLLKLDRVHGRLRVTEPWVVLPSGFEIRRLYSLAYGTAAYVIPRKDAVRLLASRPSLLSDAIDMTVYDPYSKVNRASPIFVVKPALARQPPGGLSRDTSMVNPKFLRRRTLADFLTLLPRWIGDNVTPAPSKFMQDYVWGIKKHRIDFRPD